MKLSIDASVQTETKALGTINGQLELPSIPHVGAKISFISTSSGLIPPDCNLILAIENVVFTPAKNASTCASILLEPIYLKSDQELMTVSKYLLDGFGLHVDEL
jgi:hypothetical protein